MRTPSTACAADVAVPGQQGSKPHGSAQPGTVQAADVAGPGQQESQPDVPRHTPLPVPCRRGGSRTTRIETLDIQHSTLRPVCADVAVPGQQGSKPLTGRAPDPRLGPPTWRFQ